MCVFESAREAKGEGRKGWSVGVERERKKGIDHDKITKLKNVHMPD